MRLAAAILFATSHKQFLDTLDANSLDPGSAKGLLAKTLSENHDFVHIEILMDFGAPGPHNKDVGIKIRFEKGTGNFVFDNVAIRL